MKFKEKYNINPEFESIFEFNSEKDELKHDAKILMFRFLSEIEKLSDNGKLAKKELAAAINTSGSFITQLFKGDKIANLVTFAKLQKKYNVEFEIKAVPVNSNSISLDAANGNGIIPMDFRYLNNQKEPAPYKTSFMYPIFGGDNELKQPVNA